MWINACRTRAAFHPNKYASRSKERGQDWREEFMAHIVVLGGGIGGVSCAYELKKTDAQAGSGHACLQPAIVPIHAVQSLGGGQVAREGRHHHWSCSGFVSARCGFQRRRCKAGLSAGSNRVELGDGSSIAYDYLVVATGPELAFDEVEGLGPETQQLIRSATSIMPPPRIGIGRNFAKILGRSSSAPCRARPASGRPTNSP